ncbi:MAG: hypothetical protein PVJ15_04380 [Gammaproteobacteria bacterium]|jgi:hypothetical protein
MMTAMSLDRELQRYAAYFRGWCQAFGEHRSIPGEDMAISWLIGDDQFGFILPRQLTRSLYRGVLGKREPPVLTISRSEVRAGDFHYPVSAPSDRPGLEAMQQFLEDTSELHVFLSSHFMYGSGTRIITLARKKPLAIIYKEIGPMRLRLLGS